MNSAVALDFTEERVCARSRAVAGASTCPRASARLKPLPACPTGSYGSLSVIQSEHERAKVLARAARIGVAADDALLPPHDLDLQPLAAALLLCSGCDVWRRCPPGCAALPRQTAPFPRRRSGRNTAPNRRWKGTRDCSNRFRNSKIHLHQVEAVKIEQVEGVVGDRDVALRPAVRGGRPRPSPVRCCIRLNDERPPFVERYDFAVENGSACFDVPEKILAPDRLAVRSF